MLNNYPILPFINAGSTSLSDQTEKTNLHLSNYPNPANTYTRLLFTGIGSQTQIMLFDAKGSTLMELANDYYASGNHELFIDTSILPSGLYYYRLNNGVHQQTGKLVIER
jgi:hypothetical protein